MPGFVLIDTSRDGRIIRQTFARGLGTAGCLVLVSTTLYMNMERPADSGPVNRDHPIRSVLPEKWEMSTEDMITNVPIDSVCESLAYVPGVKIGQNGLEPIPMDKMD